jgi:hypothetical protein
MSSKKKKRLEAFVKRKLKKDDRVSLIASLACVSPSCFASFVSPTRRL